MKIKYYFFRFCNYLSIFYKNSLLGFIAYLEGKVFKNITEENASKLYRHYLIKT